jgi:hypothetical protein
VFRRGTATNKDLGQISQSTLILSMSAQQIKVYLHYLDMSYAQVPVDQPSPASNTLPSPSNASSSNASSSKSRIPSVTPNTRSPESQQPSSSSNVLNLTAPQSDPIPSSQLSLLSSLREKVEKLPRTVPLATKTHILAGYSQSPQKLTSDIENDADVWETWDRKLNVFLQCNDDELKQLVVRGKFGLIGLVGFFEHLVRDRKVDERLLEGKAKRLVDAIDVYVSYFLCWRPSRFIGAHSAINLKTNVTSSDQQSKSLLPDTPPRANKAGGRRLWQPPKTISPK